MRCELCKKKSAGIPMPCNWCNHNFCVSCIDVSIHSCKNLKDYMDKKRNELETRLAYEMASKIKVF